MDNSQSYNKNTPDDNNTPTQTYRESINRILSEFGLDPKDYIFNSSLDITSDLSLSLFEKLPTTTAEPNFHHQAIVKAGRPLSYVEQPPPPPPVINRQKSKSRTPSGMSQSEASTPQTPQPPYPPPPPPPPVPQATTLAQIDSNKDESNLSAEYYLNHINSLDNPPVKVVKPNSQELVYRKEIRIRYLQPPTPPPPAPIIIREKQLPPRPPESPLLIRERKPVPPTPPPLIIRERPPSPPAQIEPYVIDKPLPPPPPPPRQIIIERLPTPPPKPRTVIFEKWLPYKRVKRPILLEKAPPIPPPQQTRNVIVEYEPLKAYTVRRVIEEGVFRVDPAQYRSYIAETDPNVRLVDRIDDLPPPSEELKRILKEYNQPNVKEYTSAAASSVDQLANISNISTAPPRPPERVLSKRRDSSIPRSSSATMANPQVAPFNPLTRHQSQFQLRPGAYF